MAYVDHPRFGNEPRITGFDVKADAPGVHLHWINRMERVTHYHQARPIPGTAIAADTDKQTAANFPVTHYYDVEVLCEDCERKFLFFADEQKYWYEALGFPLEAHATRCAPCRKSVRALQTLRFRYEDLVALEDLDEDQELELCDCRLQLIEERVFSSKQSAAVRAFVNKFPDHPRAAEFSERIARIPLYQACGSRQVRGHR